MNPITPPIMNSNPTPVVEASESELSIQGLKPVVRLDKPAGSHVSFGQKKIALVAAAVGALFLSLGIVFFLTESIPDPMLRYPFAVSFTTIGAVDLGVIISFFLWKSAAP